ncbi:alpha/beta fold hydrolase [Nocardia mangyaensis]|uniref:alpha/beta fold hydrolase n=1 Tax=Nocardia mangyaensis TaxID=2213200 RepID=UPI0026774C2A|nr:alpha/beta fold hydrolase [Nocardia mangyaensis]MDO3645842.1 alpha/beta fold hydrolase [Nocardia mangyaensis]
MQLVYRGDDARTRVRAWCGARLGAWRTPHELISVSTGAGSTNVVTVGARRAEAPTVVVVPGTNMCAAVSLDLLDVLARRWHTVLADLPGQPGLSADRRPRRGRMDWYARWLTDVLDHVDPGPVVVVGHSLGGAIALACPSPRITARVLLAPAGLIRLSVPPRVLTATIPWMTRPSPSRTERLLAHLLTPGVQAPSHLVEWMTMAAADCRSSLAPPPLSADLLDSRHGSRCVVAVGDHDAFLPPRRLGPVVRDRFAEEVRVLNGVGHLLLADDYAEVGALVDSVL